MTDLVQSKFGSDVSVQSRGSGFLPNPSSVKEALDVAQLMAKSGPMVGKAFRGNPGACLAIYMQAGRLGMDPFALSLKAYEVNGSIAYEAQGVASMVYASPLLEGRLSFDYEHEGTDDMTVTVTGRVKGTLKPCVYKSPPLATLRDGAKSPLWKRDPGQQLAYYGTRAWARRYVPDVLMGVYTVDEVNESAIKNVTPADNAASRLTQNLEKFEADRVQGLKAPEEAVIASEYDDEFEGVADFAVRLEDANTALEVQVLHQTALNCSWAEDEDSLARIEEAVNQRIRQIEIIRADSKIDEDMEV